MLHKNLRLNFKNVDSFVNFISKKFENENFTEIDLWKISSEVLSG